MTLKINGYHFIYFNALAIELSLDKVASIFSIDVRFDPKNPIHRKLFKPLAFPSVEIYNDQGQLELTGTIISHAFSSSSAPSLLKVSGYSLPGILENVTIPLQAYPLESINRSIKDITEKLIGLFGLTLVVDPSVSDLANRIISKSVASPSESIKSYLSKLTAQKNIVLSHNAKGNLVFYKLNLSAQPIYLFTKLNALSMSFGVQGASLHSEISVIRQPSITSKNATLKDSVVNTMVEDYRPSVTVLSSGDTTDTKNAANNRLAAQLLQMPLSVVVTGDLSIPIGAIVEVENDALFLFKRTRFIVKALKKTQTSKQRTQSYTLVLPEAFTGETPKHIFQ